jgi:hypothetical protein
LDPSICKRIEGQFIDCIDRVLAFCDGGIVVEPPVCTEQEISKMWAEGNAFPGQALGAAVVFDEERSCIGSVRPQREISG